MIFLIPFFFLFDSELTLKHLRWQEAKLTAQQAHQCQGYDSSALLQSADGLSVICLSGVSKVCTPSSQNELDSQM